MVSRKEWYARTNASWPAEVPPLTADEAKRAARKLYRFVRRRKLALPITITSGNRYSYPHGGVLYLNPSRGWKTLLHDLSHWLDPGRGHSKDHARLEARMIREVLKRGWLSGALMVEEKPKIVIDPKIVRHKRVLAGIERWQAKLRRAENALAKLNRQNKRYERIGV